MKLSRRIVAAAATGLVAVLWSSAGTARDGQHDFDFNVGVWHTHIKRIKDALSGGTQSVELEGTVAVRKVWGGRAELEEIEADGPEGHFEGLTLFLYNPRAQQWSQSFINSSDGDLAAPLIGEFKDGHGELFSQDTLGGRTILVRGVWSDITPDTHSFVESYSADGGKTWAPSFIAHLTRERQAPKTAPPPAPAAGAADPQHDFDFDFGSWKTHSSRLMHPLSGAREWKDMDGGTNVTRIWGGRANLAEYKATGPAGDIELLALRWYNPKAHQWSLDFATPSVGVLGAPGVGEFHNGRGVFYDTEPINGRSVLVRFSIWGISADSAQSEQAFSTDGGQTWEVNWVNKYTRAAP
jgi:hypothetical protein